MLKKWKKKELKDAKDFGGKLQPHSGSGWSLPSDVLNNRFSIDSKYTTKRSFSLSLETWDKLCEEAAWNKERIPLLSLSLHGTELVVLSKEDFLKITKED